MGREVGEGLCLEVHPSPLETGAVVLALSS